MKLTLRTSLALAALALALTPSQSRAAIAYAVSNVGASLVSFDTATPGSITTIGNFSGAVSSVTGLDFRIANGLLYGYDNLTNTVVTINLSTAFTTFASTPTTGTNNFDLGIDFNPAADRLRLVNVNDQNLRINVDTGATTVDGLLAYAAGDPNFGVSPTVNEVAYINNDNNPGTGTQLYYVDYGTDTLVTTTNPNGGVLNTVGALGVNADLLTGFDILTDPFFGTNSAFAVLRVAGVSSLYSINLGTGAATSLGALGNNSLFGLAVAPVAVPEPGTALAGLIALGACGTTRLRRRGEA